METSKPDQPVKNDKVTYQNFRKIATCQGDEYTASCFYTIPISKNITK